MPKSSRSAFVLAIGLVAAPAAAQQPDPVAAGHDLASKLCTACHIVGNEARGSDLAPPFRAIAKDPQVTITELHGWGGTGHPMLPNLALTPQQVADINAYLDSLRDGPASPEEPAAPAAGSPLPQAPPDKIGPPIKTQPAPQ